MQLSNVSDILSILVCIKRFMEVEGPRQQGQGRTERKRTNHSDYVIDLTSKKIYLCGCFACMYIFVLNICLVPKEPEGGISSLIIRVANYLVGHHIGARN